MKTITLLGEDDGTHRYLSRRLKSMHVERVARYDEFKVGEYPTDLAILKLDADFPPPLVRVARELEIPVYLYEEAARAPERRNLAFFRKGGLAALTEAIGSDPLRAPDLGPARLHPSAGALVTGARFFLIAYNVELATGDLALARKIAREVRESSGGLPAVKALGLPLARRGTSR